VPPFYPQFTIILHFYLLLVHDVGGCNDLFVFNHKETIQSIISTINYMISPLLDQRSFNASGTSFSSRIVRMDSLCFVLFHGISHSESNFCRFTEACKNLVLCLIWSCTYNVKIKKLICIYVGNWCILDNQLTWCNSFTFFFIFYNFIIFLIFSLLVLVLRYRLSD